MHDKINLKRKNGKQNFLLTLRFSKFHIFVMTFLHAIEITPQKASSLTYESSFLSTNLELQRCVAALILISPSQRDDGAPRIPITFLIFSYLTFLFIFLMLSVELIVT